MRRNLVAFGILGGFLLAVGALVGLLVWKDRQGEPGSPSRPLIGGPSEEKEGQNWSKEELVAYLKSCGLTHAKLAYAHSSWAHDTTFICFEPSMSQDDMAKANSLDLKGAVSVWSGPFAKSAHSKDQASEVNAKHPGTAFGWGRFVFIGDPTYISKLIALLK